MAEQPDVPVVQTDGDEYFYSKYITLKNGKRIYAAAYGLKAFRFKRRNKTAK